MDVWPRVCARNPRTHVRAQVGRHSRASRARVSPIPSDAPPQATNKPTQTRQTLARFARSGAPDSLRCPSATRCRSGAQASVYALSPCALAVGLCLALAAYGLQVARVSRGL